MSDMFGELQGVGVKRVKGVCWNHLNVAKKKSLDLTFFSPRCVLKFSIIVARVC